MKKNVLIALSLFISYFSFADEIIKEFHVKKGQNFILDSPVGGEIQVKSWDKKVVKIRISYEESFSDILQFDFNQDKTGILLKAKSGSRSLNQEYGDIIYEILVPQEFNIDLITSGGSLEIAGIQGNIKGETSGGNIVLADLQGDLQLLTAGGHINLDNLIANGEVKTSGGNIIANNIEGELSLKTSGGNIQIDGAEFDGEVKTHGGHLSINDVKGKIDFRTSGGYIDLNNAQIDGEVRTNGGFITVENAPFGADVITAGGHIMIGSAKEYVQAATAGGDIEIKEVEGWVNANTSGGNIDVKVNGNLEKGKRDVELLSEGGNITLSVPKNFSMRVEIELIYDPNKDEKFTLSSDFNLIEEQTDVTLEDGTMGKKITAVANLNGGEHLVKLSTQNGSINLFGY